MPRRDGSVTIADSWLRVYYRRIPPGTIWCSYHERPHDKDSFPPSVRHRRSAWCTEAHREGQAARRAASSGAER